MASATFCAVCAGPLAEKFRSVRDPQTGESFEIAACTRCGLGQTFPQPEDLGRYYGAAYHGGRYGFTASYSVGRRLRVVRRAAGSSGGRRLLDIGCGDGKFLLAARGCGWTPYGTEFNASISRAAGLTVWNDLEEARASAPYAVITLWHSLEHMRHPRGVIERAASMLEADGTMIVAVPNAAGFQADLFGAGWFGLDVPRHLFHFSPRSLSILLEAAGLGVTRLLHMEAEHDLFGWAQSALNQVCPEPNLFFHQLTGRPVRAGRVLRAANLAAGGLLAVLAIPLAAAGALTGKSATVVIVAQKQP